MADPRTVATPERLPVGSPYVDSHHIAKALTSLRHAQKAADPRDRELLLQRAQAEALHAERELATVQSLWREYNARVDAIEAFLLEHETAGGAA